MCVALAAGNAVQLLVTPPAGAIRYRILRKLSDVWAAGPDDPDAFVTADETEFTPTCAIYDFAQLVNGTPYFYKPYYLLADGLTWQSGASVGATPAATFQVRGPDVLMILRDRLESGFASLIERGELQVASGRVSVLLAPPASDETSWPVVTLHCDDDSSGERALGESIVEDFYDGNDEWLEREGWLSQVRITIVLWSLNPEERSLMRRLLRGVVQANFPILSAAGCSLMELRLSESEDMESYGVPVFQVTGVFTCMATAFVENGVPAIKSVNVQVVNT